MHGARQTNFTDRTLTDRKAEHVGLVDNRRVNSLHYALPDFLEPRSWIVTVNNARQEFRSLGDIVAISTNVGFGQLRV